MSQTKVARSAPSLVAKMAERFGVDADKLLSTLKATAFKVKGGEVSNEQMMALLVVAEQYGLNPFTKEIYAFPDKQNGIVPVVGVDGWSRLINSHDSCNGVEFRYSNEIVTSEAGEHKHCPEWCEAIIYRKDREHPAVVREYLDEVYRPISEGVGQDGKPWRGKPGPWQTHTKRMLRHKALIQCARIGMGYVGIFDEDEAHRIIERDMGNAVVVEEPPKLRDQLRVKQKPVEPEPAPEVDDGPEFSMSYAEVAGRLNRATTREALDEAASLINLVQNEAQRQELNALYENLYQHEEPKQP